MTAPIKSPPSTLQRLVAEYLKSDGQAQANRLHAYTQQHGVSDAELQRHFADYFDAAGATAASPAPVELAPALPTAHADLPRAPPNLFGSITALAGGLIHASASISVGVASAAADLLNPVSRVGEAIYDSVQDAGLSGQRAAAAAWLQKRNLGPAEQQAILSRVKQATDWHGTGRYQYAAAGTNKYDGLTNTVVDKLQQIVDAGGLTPQFDAYYRSGATDGATISMAQSHMYARYYAHIHQSSDRDLQFQYGTDGEWMKAMGSHLSVSGIGEVLMGYAFGDQPAADAWARSVSRQPQFGSVITGEQRSDIPGNHAVLFGVRGHNIHRVALSSRMNRIEQRTDKPISFDDMTHVEVPAHDVAATEQLLRARGIELPVLAIEDVEAVLSRFSTSQLVNGRLSER